MSSVDGELLRDIAAFTARFPDTKLAAWLSAEPEALVIAVDGNLDTNDSAAFQTLLMDALGGAKTSGGLVIELSDLKYLSSTGVGALTSILAETQRHGIPMWLCRLPTRARMVLDVLGFTAFFSAIEDCAPRPLEPIRDGR
jgi:anti-anti-sigma factor